MSDDEGEGAPPLFDDGGKQHKVRKPRGGDFVPTYISKNGKYSFMTLKNNKETVQFRVKYHKEYPTEIPPIFRPGDIIKLRFLDDGANSATIPFEVVSTDGAFTARSPYFGVTARPSNIY
jgi:hypothetical protein